MSSGEMPPLLPRPSLTFTVPSLHDGLPIDCRVFHPQSLGASADAPPWHRHAAVVAHPYAPLGGCYDDPVVDIVGGTLLRLGFLVVTFNFRGAHGSAGRTSWTAKAERADYMSVVGFVSHYVHYLDPFEQAVRPRQTQGKEMGLDGDAVAPAIHVHPPSPGSSSPGAPAPPPVILLGGYSYGAMITSRLPPLSAIVDLFSSPKCGSPAAEIRLRAQHLAEMQNTVLAGARDAALGHARPNSPRTHLKCRVGGDEDSRKSHEQRRPLSVELEETIRHGVAELMAKTGKHRSRSRSSRASRELDDGRRATEQEIDCLLPISGLIDFHPAYLLVSPLQGVVTNLATMSLPPAVSSIPGKLWNRLSPRQGRESAHPGPEEPTGVGRTVSAEAEDKLTQNPTLAIYGDRDGFVPVRKLRDWASRLETVQGSKFRAHEVSGANHFWAQGNVANTLGEAVRAFGKSLLDGTVR